MAMPRLTFSMVPAYMLTGINMKLMGARGSRVAKAASSPHTPADAPWVGMPKSDGIATPNRAWSNPPKTPEPR